MFKDHDMLLEAEHVMILERKGQLATACHDP
jgi:hypothetical protein